MPTTLTPGFTGFQYGRISSRNKRAIGKFTDSNHLRTLADLAPTDYDKKIIQIYTQSAAISNDFMAMINQSTPFYADGSDSWKWKIEVPFEYAKIVEVPASTSAQTKPGIDGQEIQLILDTNEFGKNETIVIGHRTFGPQLAIIADPIPVGKAWLYTMTYLSSNPQSDYIDSNFLKVGMEVQAGTSFLTEFSQDMPGLGRGVDSIEMFESLSSPYGRKHTVTKLADQISVDGKAMNFPKDAEGNDLDMVVYAPQRRNSTTKINSSSMRWESYIEFMLRKRMISDKAWRQLHGKAGVVRDGSKYGSTKLSDGAIQRIRKHGHYVPFYKGTFSHTLLRKTFGDLFYGRVAMNQRHVKLYTNEAGFNLFQQTAKEDAINSGLTLYTNVNAIQAKGINATDPSQHLVYGWAFDSTFTRETGLIELVHLAELDQPQLNLEFGQDKRTAPIFLCFNVSPDSDGTFNGNIREVRVKGAPSMTWGYVDGRQSHLGHSASQGMQSANLFPGYTIWFEDRSDIFIEDLSRVVLIEELPQF